MHELYTYLEDVGMGSFHELSHGESFLQLIQSRAFGPRGPRPGLYLFDEVESALSFTSSLWVLGLLRELLADERVQVVLATHSPVSLHFRAQPSSSWPGTDSVRRRGQTWILSSTSDISWLTLSGSAELPLM